MQIHTKDDPLPDPASIETFEDADYFGIMAFDADGDVLGCVTTWASDACDLSEWR